jgi:transposase
MAHARRKFFELCPAGNPLEEHAANHSPLAAEALARMGELYAIEARGGSWTQAPAANCARRRRSRS